MKERNIKVKRALVQSNFSVKSFDATTDIPIFRKGNVMMMGLENLFKTMVLTFEVLNGSQIKCMIWV